jgi:mono/diheme cytochrome c family protein
MCRSALLVLAVLLCSGCGRDWRTDMWYQPALRAADAPRPQPPGSIALGAELMPGSRDDAADLANPVPPSPASLAHGRALFLARCAPCHGREGHGGGPVSRYFPPAPDLANPTIRKRVDGEIFGTITFGGKAMPSQVEGLSASDRWDLVNHVRTIQQGSAAP